MRYRLLSAAVVGLIFVTSSACGLRDERTEPDQRTRPSAPPSYPKPDWVSAEKICKRLEGNESVSESVLEGYELRPWGNSKTSGRVQCSLAGKSSNPDLKHMYLEITISEIRVYTTVGNALAERRRDFRDRGFKERGNCAAEGECWLRGTNGGAPAFADALYFPYDVHVALAWPRGPGQDPSWFRYRVDEGAVLVLRETLDLLQPWRLSATPG